MRTARPTLAVPAALAALVAATMPGLALAQSNARALLDDRFVFNLGTYLVNSDVTARLDGQSTQNPEIDFDKTFGNDKDASRFRFDAMWRIAPAHRVRLGYFNNERFATKVLDQAIDWGDYHYAVGARVDSESQMDVTTLSYEYAFWRRPDYEVAASIGVHYSKIEMKLSGQASVTDSNGNVTVLPVATRQESVPAPLPVIGLRAGWLVAPNWFVEAQGQFFKVKVDEVDGNWSDIRANVTWMFARNWGVGLGYERFYNRVDVDGKTFNGKLKYGYSGLQAYLTAAF